MEIKPFENWIIFLNHQINNENKDNKKASKLMPITRRIIIRTNGRSFHAPSITNASEVQVSSLTPIYQVMAQISCTLKNQQTKHKSFKE